MADILENPETDRIRTTLKDHPEGMSIKEISAAVSMSRNSVAKYLEIMTIAGQLEVRHVGNAKLYSLSRRVPVGDLLNHARELIIVLDNELRVVQASGSFCGFTGLPRESLLHTRLSSLPSPLLTPAEEQELVTLLGGGPSWKKEIHISRAGADIYFESRFLPTVMENGTPGITLILQDVTEQTLAKRASAEKERLLYTLFQIPTSPQFFIDRNHKVVYWDRALEILTGLRAEDMVGTSNHWRAFHAQPRPCLADLLVDGKITDVAVYYPCTLAQPILVEGRYEVTDFFPDIGHGGRWLHVTATLIRDTSGTITGAMETVEDVSGQKQGRFVVQK